MLTLDEVADHWRLKPAAVRARVAAGQLRAVRIAGRYRTTWPDVWACEVGRKPGGALADRYRTPLITKADIAAAMKVSTRTVERWMHDGLPTRSVGGNTRFSRMEVATWLRARFGVDSTDLLAACGRAGSET